MGNSKTINLIAIEVGKKLISNGIMLRVYTAYSTNSIYLKLDEGVCNSIRISDHRGKKELKYRYNIIKGEKPHHKMDTYIRYYVGFGHVNDIIETILKDRDRKLKKYTKTGYHRLMVESREKNKDQYGFWTKAIIVNTTKELEDALTN